MNQQIVNHRPWVAFRSGINEAVVAIDCIAGFEEDGFNVTLVHLTGGQSIQASMNIQKFKALIESTNR